MRVIEIRYEHKVPRAQYESEMVSATAILSDNEVAVDSIEELKALVNSGLVKRKSLVVAEPAQEALPITEPETKTTPEAETKTETDSEKKKREAAEKKKKDAEEKKKAKAEEKAKKDAKKKEDAEQKKADTEKKKFVIYDRSEESHKKELGNYLDEFYPGWEIDKTPKAAALSQSMSGKVAVYEKKSGEITQDFKDAIKEGMK